MHKEEFYSIIIGFVNIVKKSGKSIESWVINFKIAKFPIRIVNIIDGISLI